MFKYSITKKQVYALVLESKKITYKPRQKNYSVKKIISKKELLYTYDSSLEKITRTNFHLNPDCHHNLIFLPQFLSMPCRC